MPHRAPHTPPLGHVRWRHSRSLANQFLRKVDYRLITPRLHTYLYMSAGDRRHEEIEGTFCIISLSKIIIHDSLLDAVSLPIEHRAQLKLMPSLHIFCRILHILKHPLHICWKQKRLHNKRL